MLNDSYWKEYNDGERAFLRGADDNTIAYIQRKNSFWYCIIYPELINRSYYFKGINDSIEEVEWQVTLDIYNKCNEIANQLHKIRDHLPSVHELAERARKEDIG